MDVPTLELHENPSSGSRDDTCGQTEEQADTKKLIVVIANLQTRLKLG
jgi:hypothetical protein